MTLQGNGNILIAKSLSSSRPTDSIVASRDLDTKQYQMFLSVASVRELEGDLVLPSTWRFIR